jgi:hypothetical protein
VAYFTLHVGTGRVRQPLTLQPDSACFQRGLFLYSVQQRRRQNLPDMTDPDSMSALKNDETSRRRENKLPLRPIRLQKQGVPCFSWLLNSRCWPGRVAQCDYPLPDSFVVAMHPLCTLVDPSISYRHKTSPLYSWEQYKCSVVIAASRLRIEMF